MTQNTLPSASIVFTAHNRRDLVLEAIACAKRQTVPVEILVMDDASTDGTEEAVRSLHPDVRYERAATSKGLCYQRNRGTQLATGEIVFCLDDDSMLDSPRTVEQTLGEFVERDIVAVAIPFREVLIRSSTTGEAPTAEIEYATSAPQGCSQAHRREVVLKVGGYRESLKWGMEESCLAIRCLQIGGITKVGRADPIRHMAKPGFRARTNYHFRRSTLIFYFTYAPPALVPLMLCRAFAGGAVSGFRNGGIVSAIGGLLDGLWTIATNRVRRHRVEPGAFRLFRDLRRSGAMPLEDVRRRLAATGIKVDAALERLQ